MFSVDDGLITGHYDLADVFFLIAVILAVLAAASTRVANGAAWTGFLGWLAVGMAAFGWLVL